MSKKDRLLSILEHSQQVLGAFVAGLSAEERAAVGTYEQWCPKDSVAHVAYWIEQRAARLAAVARGEEPPPLPAHYEQANAACFQRFCNCPWPEVQAYMDAAYTQLLAVVRSLGEEVLTAPSADAHERPLWTDIVATAYTHPAMHVAEQYARQGKPQAAAQLWQEWSRLVSPLDDSAEWQGLVHYNTACSLALSGNAQQAIAELRQALQLRPQLKAWSKQDTDLNSLHDLPEYRKLYAAEYWWKALDAGPLAEALADQFLRALAMFREAVAAFPADEWRKGDTPY